MKKKNKVIIYLGIVFLFTLLFLSLTQLTMKNISPSTLPVQQTQNNEGTMIHSYNIMDIEDCHVINTVNYTASEYVLPQKTSNSTDQIANKGTYQILITNLDPFDPEFTSKSEKLEGLKGTDDNWHLTLYLPPIFSSCNIYVRSRLEASVGTISNYHFNDYDMSTLPDTEIHTSKTSPIFLDLTLYSNRKFFSPNDPIQNGVLVTIHYESLNENFTGIHGKILIGKDSAVRKVVSTNKTSISFGAITAIIILAITLFVSILKHRYLDFISQILFILGLFGIMLFSYLYKNLTPIPYVIQGFYYLSYGIILLGGAFATNKRIGKIPIKIPLVILSCITCIFLFLKPICPENSYTIVSLSTAVLLGILIVLIPVTTIFSAFKGAKRELCLGSMICPILVGYAFLTKDYLTIFSPIFTLSIYFLAITVYVCFREFVLTEKQCNYLTANLQAEVTRQTKELEGIISERDQLLRYLSHDLKKPVTSIQKCLQFLKSEDEHERSSAIQNIEHKVDVISNDLIEIQKFAKTNYSPEQTVVLDLDKIIETVYYDLNPDCEANGIYLRYTSSNLSVFAKPVALNSVIQNLIFNALEHANCSQINMSARKEKNICILTISDNGKGIEEIQNIFNPYQTSYDTKENLGLGLYICKQHIQSMGGDLTYQRVNDKSMFTITLPIA